MFQGFPRGSPLIPDINKALLKVSESGELQELENKMVATQSCEEVGLEDSSSISATSYWVLFTLTGVTSTVALAVYAVHCYSKHEEPTFRNKIIWGFMSAVITHLGHRNKWFRRKVSDVESPAITP